MALTRPAHLNVRAAEQSKQGKPSASEEKDKAVTTLADKIIRRREDVLRELEKH